MTTDEFVIDPPLPLPGATNVPSADAGCATSAAQQTFEPELFVTVVMFSSEGKSPIQLCFRNCHSGDFIRKHKSELAALVEFPNC